MRQLNRRDVLVGSATATMVGLVGCIGDGDDAPSEDGDDAPAGDAEPPPEEDTDGDDDPPEADDDEQSTFDPSLDIRHEYEHHADHNLQDLAYDEAHDMVWSIDGALEDSSRFRGYDVADGDIAVTETFDILHSIEVAEGVVYVASGGDLYEYDVEGGEFAEHPAELTGLSQDLVFDADRNWLWSASETEIVAYDADTGELTTSYEVHDEGISTIDIHGRFVASGETWEDNLIVYDLDAEAVVFNPEIGYNGGIVHFTEAGSLVVGAGETVRLYNVESEELLLESQGHVFGTSGVDYLVEQDVIVSAGFDNAIRLHGVEDGGVIEEYSHDDTIYTVAIDDRNDLLWFGDGEDDNPGTVYGMDLS